MACRRRCSLLSDVVCNAKSTCLETLQGLTNGRALDKAVFFLQQRSLVHCNPIGLAVSPLAAVYAESLRVWVQAHHVAPIGYSRARTELLRLIHGRQPLILPFCLCSQPTSGEKLGPQHQLAYAELDLQVGQTFMWA